MCHVLGDGVVVTAWGLWHIKFWNKEKCCFIMYLELTVVW